MNTGVKTKHNKDCNCYACNDHEPRVYVVNLNDTDFQFNYKHPEKCMDEAEKLGSVYSLIGFQNAINNEELSLNCSFIFISNK